MEKRSEERFLWPIAVIFLLLIVVTIIQEVKAYYHEPDIEEVYMENDIYYFNRNELEVTFEKANIKIVFPNRVTFDKGLEEIKKESILKEYEKIN